jgi:sec-independent protein translocase protein TatA
MLGNIGPMQLLIIFLIVLLIFGTKKLRNVGGDLGSAIRDFRKGMSSEEDSDKGDEADADKSEPNSDDQADDKSTSEKSFKADSGKPKS